MKKYTEAARTRGRTRLSKSETRILEAMAERVAENEENTLNASQLDYSFSEEHGGDLDKAFNAFLKDYASDYTLMHELTERKVSHEDFVWLVDYVSAHVDEAKDWDVVNTMAILSTQIDTLTEEKATLETALTAETTKLADLVTHLGLTYDTETNTYS